MSVYVVSSIGSITSSSVNEIKDWRGSSSQKKINIYTNKISETINLHTSDNGSSFISIVSLGECSNPRWRMPINSGMKVTTHGTLNRNSFQTLQALMGCLVDLSDYRDALQQKTWNLEQPKHQTGVYIYIYSICCFPVLFQLQNKHEFEEM